MSVQTFQSGAPQTREYKDVLGRTLRAASEGFNGVWVFQDSQYNARGLMTGETQPYYSNQGRQWTLYSDFDVLGRVQQKVTPQTSGSLTTSYAYNGLTTDISVAATTSDVGNLSLSRTYNTLEQLVETEDANGGTTRYAYDGAGNPIVIEDANHNRITAQYDALGRKNYVNDPNQGLTSFTYNDFGELEKEVDANNQSIRYDMDLLGRVTSRLATASGTTRTASFIWDTRKNGLLTSQSEGASAQSYFYDSAARITRTDVTIDGSTYITRTQYDSHYGRPLSMTYPGRDSADGIKIKYEYNSRGYLTHEKNANTDFVYRTVTAQDAFGNIQNATLNGDTLSGTYLYHGTTGQMLSSRVKQASTDLHYFNYTDYDSYGNLKTQRNEINSASDTYTYDSLHRLTQSSITASGETNQIDYAYDAVGNILKKSDYSADNNTAYRYTENTNKLSQITLKDNSVTSFTYDNKGNQTHRNGTQEVTYNVFNKPLTINKNGSQITLNYGADLARYKQTRTVQEDGQSKTITTHYIGKHYEVEFENTPSGTQQTRKSYLNDVAIFTDSDQEGVSIAYTHRDRLGSATTFTDHNNQVTARRFFDPFGKPRNGDGSPIENLTTKATLGNNLLDSTMSTRRGFTDHEHLDEAEIIHMNGRVYDYNVGRFMSVDPVIQSPTNTQSVNPYSYIMNNPLAGTDPTGYTSCPQGQECAENIQVKDEKVAMTGSRIARKTGAKVVSGTITDKNGTKHNFTATVSNGAYSGTVNSTATNGTKARASFSGTLADTGGQGQTNALKGASYKFGSDDENLFIESDRNELNNELYKINSIREELDVFETEEEAAIWLNDNAGHLQEKYDAEVGAIIGKVYGDNTGWKIGNIVTSYHSNLVDLSSSKIKIGKMDFIDKSINGRSDWHTHTSGSHYASWGSSRDSHKSYYRAYVSSVGSNGKPSLSLYNSPEARRAAWPLTRSAFDKANTCIKGGCR